MLQRLIAAVLGVLGLVAIGLGVASATAWRADDVLVATSTLAADGSHLAVTAPGVLELADDSVEVTITAADDADVVLAVGRDTDVEGWVGADAHVRITGLSGWHELRTDQVAAPAPTGDASAATPTDAAGSTESAEPTEPAAEPSPSGTAAGDATTDGPAVDVADPTGSDLWVAQATGTGSASLQWTAQPGRWSLVAANLGAGPATVALAWPQVVTTPWLWPGVLVGALLLLTAAVLALRLWRRHRRGDVEPDWHAVTTGMIAVVPAPGGDAGGAPGAAGAGASTAPDAPAAPLTRRQIREALAAQEEVARRRGRGGRALTGAVPVVAPPVAPPADEPRTDVASTSTSPVVEPATSKASGGARSADTSPTAWTPADASSTDKTSTEAPTDKAPTDKAPTDTTSTGTIPTDGTPPGGEPGPEDAPATRRGLRLRRRAVPAADVADESAPADTTESAAAPTPSVPDTPTPTVVASPTAPEPWSAPAAPTVPAPAEPPAETPAEPGSHRRGLFGRRNRTAAPDERSDERPPRDDGPAETPSSPTSQNPAAADPPSRDQSSSAADDLDADDVPRPVFPPVVAAESLGPRADAWRKAWGFPTEPAEPTDTAGPTAASSSPGDERTTDGPAARPQQEEGR
ncbi:hypothetical protein AGMMS50218_10780 [Actinomycetota bacterium]|nr:hypothetical protein AGMMS50218_10780 [Actinomycetota bacterium]